METERLETLEQVRGFVAGIGDVAFEFTDRESAYGFIRRTLVQFGYHGQGKGVLRAYMGKVTGMSRAQVTRLIQHTVLLRLATLDDRDGERQGSVPNSQHRPD